MKISEKKIKGIVLAGGRGTRLAPLTNVISKQMLPLYDKPILYYSISILLACKIREIAIVVDPEQRQMFENFLGDGSDFGVTFTFITQENPEGIPQAYVLSSEFLDGSDSLMILGDNFFFGSTLFQTINSVLQKRKNTIFSYSVAEPSEFGVCVLDSENNVQEIVEKPKTFISDKAVTGLYFLDGSVCERARNLVKSGRGEFEMADLLNTYITENSLCVEELGRGVAWLDTGTFQGLLDAANFVRTIQTRQNLLVGSPHEISWRAGLISKSQIEIAARKYQKSAYGRYLKGLK